jgi:glycosyltransferase involved in cell wall biosynthesis
MRIIYFSADYGPHDHRFLSALARTQHTVFFLRLERLPGQVERRLLPPRIQQLHWKGGAHRFRWVDLFVLLPDLKRVLRETQPDIVHAGPIQTCAFLAVLSGFRPILTMSWGYDLMQDAERNAWWRWVTGYTLRNSTYFTCDARASRARALWFGMEPAHTSMFPWGVDLEHFSPAARRRALKPRRSSTARAGNRRGRPFAVLCNRSWEPRYGVDVLARAFVIAAAQHPGLSLTLLGGGSQAPALRSILAAPGLANRVEFAGHVPQSALPGWYRAADLFVSPSHIDGSSVSLLEALACGRPVLVSDIPANREWVRDGENGWLFPDGDANALARKILMLSTSPALLERAGRLARQTAERRADWRDNFGVLLKSYDKAVRIAAKNGG